ncbi:hypothetical protein BDV59DRAFT_171824 [Aspergillus ambiguus]|uniref:uncharacterized protein n=1 Tax=Aspergillus ambiguus TaxID=176160 RepID=UPI003CCCDF2B
MCTHIPALPQTSILITTIFRPSFPNGVPPLSSFLALVSLIVSLTGYHKRWLRLCTFLEEVISFPRRELSTVLTTTPTRKAVNNASLHGYNASTLNCIRVERG